jgi:hypothetical protein
MTQHLRFGQTRMTLAGTDARRATLGVAPLSSLRALAPRNRRGR